MGTTAEKLSYLNTTKTNIKEAINLSGANITDDTFRSYADKIKNSYLEVMNNGWKPIWNNWTKVNGTGTTLSLNNTEEAPMSLTYKGNTQQNGTPTPTSPIPVQVVSGDNSIEVVGKNLLDLSLAKVKALNTSGTWNNNVYTTTTGLTITMNDDNTFTVSGTSNAQEVFMLEDGRISYENGTYYLSGCINGSGTTYDLRTYNYDGTSSVAQCFTGTKQINIVNNGQNFNIAIVVRASQTLSNVVFYPMLSKLSDTTYEEYKGASYSINLGANLFNMITAFDNMKGSFGGVQYIQRDNYILLNGTSTGYNGPYTKGGYSSTEELVKMKANHTYRLLANVEHNINEIPMRIYAGTTSHNVINTKAMSNGIFYVDYTPTTDITFNQLSLIGSTASGQVHDNTKVQIAIYDITNVKTNVFYPYFTPIELCKIGTYQDKIDKSTGKNLLDMNSNVLNDCFIATANMNLATVSGATCYWFEAKDNTTYTMSRDKGDRLIIGGYNSKPQINTTGTLIYDGGESTSLTYTFTNTNYKYIVLYLSRNTTTTPNWVMINEGQTSLPYEPYGTNWYLKKEIGKVVLNGSESWSSYVYGTNSWSLSNIVSSKNANDETLIMTNKFKGISYNDRNNNYAQIFVEGGSGIVIRNTTYTTLAEAQNGMSGEPLYYILATPTYEYITDTTLISQLEEAKKSYESQTNISQTNNDLPFELDIVALSNQ